jgi:hypothetical protein
VNKFFRIRSGAFRMPDGSLKEAGDEIELPSDVAMAHADRLEEVQPKTLLLDPDGPHD